MEQNSKTVHVTVNGEIRDIRIGTPLSEVVEIALPCGGHGKCGKCKVRAVGALSPMTDSERAHLSAEEQSGHIRLACHTSVLGDCYIETLGSDDRRDKILTQTRQKLEKLAPAFRQYGVAIDIGTTTLAAQLYDVNGNLLADCGRMNPQSVCGADVISRIEAALGGEDGRLAETVCRAIDEMLTELAQKANLDAKKIDAVVITGNTAMLHLLTATSVEPLSHAPFAVKRLFDEAITANDLGLTALLPQAEIYLPPCISAFVGADTVCALLATGLCESDKTAILADIGTNGEMGLWHNSALSVCSTAAGPAFEGVGISMGMNGSAGAIDSVVVVNGALNAHVIENVAPRGICGSGLVDAIACLLQTEELDETGYLEDDFAVIDDPVVLTQQDIRMVQLAKSAICAGIRTLLQEADVSAEKVATLYIAGGFGSYLNIKNAGAIGLIPSELTEKVCVAGNAALAGAVMLLMDKNSRKYAAQLAKSATVVDLAANPVFADAYMSGMLF